MSDNFKKQFVGDATYSKDIINEVAASNRLSGICPGTDTCQIRIAAQTETIAQLQQELRVARSEATQAKAQAAFVAAERDQLRQEKEQWRVLKVAAYVDGLGANLGILYEEFQKTLNYFIEANKRKRAAQNDARRLAAERDQLRADARELAQALKLVRERLFAFETHDHADKVLAEIGAKYLEPKP